MCQIFNKRVPVGKDIIAYKVLTVNYRQSHTDTDRENVTIKAPYQCKVYQLNKRYDDCGKIYTKSSPKELYKAAIGEKYMHAFQKPKDAFHLAYMRNVKRDLHYNRCNLITKDIYNQITKEEYVVAKVILHNTNKNDEVYSGIFPTLGRDYDSYVSRSMTILEIMKDVPGEQQTYSAWKRLYR